MASEADTNSECGCTNCAQFGQPVRLIAGYDFQIVVHADGTVTGNEQLSDTPRRKRTRFRFSPSGYVIPTNRGKRREQDIRDFGFILDQVGPNRPDLPGTFGGVSASDRRGRPRGRLVDADEVRQLVAEQRASGATLETSWEIVARELGWSTETIRKAYYRRFE